MKPYLLSAMLLIFGLVIGPGSLSAEPVRTPVALAMKDGQLYLGLEIWNAAIAPPRVVIVEQWDSAPVGADRSLGQYYQSARDNATADIPVLFSSVDGSRDRLEALLTEFPDYFANYGTLETVTLSAETAWGNYRIFNELLAGGGNSQPWRDTLLCEGDNCVLSNALDASSAKAILGNRLLLFTQAFLQSSYDQAALDAAMITARAQGNTLTLQPDFVPDPSSASPFLIHADLEQLPAPRYEVGVNYDPPPPMEVALLLQLIQAMRGADEDRLEAALTPFWSSLDIEGTVQMTLPDSGAEVPAGQPQPLATFAFTWPAFRLTVADWQALTVLGIARRGDTVWLYVLPEDSDGTVGSPQLFVLDPVAGGGLQLVADEDQVFAWLILRSPLIMELVRDAYAP